MSDQKKRPLLALEIASAIDGTAFRQRAARILSISATRQLLLTSIALVAIQPGNARALTIGELQVHSSLGQAFVATTVARLAPGEVMSPGCVAAVADMPGGNASPVRLSTTVAKTAAAGEYPVRITSAAPLYEPMYEIQLKVSCPGIAALAKNYVVMLNVGIANPLTQAATTPPEALRTAPVSVQPVAAPRRATNAAPVAAETQTTVRPEPAPDIRTNVNDPGLTSELTLSTPAPATGSSIPTGSKYRVRRGDTLLTVAQRIEGRAGLSTRQFAQVLLQENPSAFIDGNPDLIKMGVVITVPNGQSSVSTARNSALTATSPAPAAEAGSAETTSTAATKQVARPTRETQEPASARPPAQTSPVVAEQSSPVTTNEQKPVAKESAQKSAPEIFLSSTANADMDSVPDSATPAQDSVSDSTSRLAAVSGSVAAPGVAAVAGNLPDSASRTTRPAPAATSVTPTPVTAAAEPNKLLAAGSGILVGALLAGLFLSRGLIAAWLPGRIRRSNQAQQPQPEQADTLVNLDIAAPEYTSATAAASADQAATNELSADFADDVDVNESPAVDAAEDAIENALAQAEAIELAALDNETGSASKEFAGAEQDATPENDAPRVSLHGSSPASVVDFDLGDMEEPLENTRRYSDPSMLAEDKPVATSEPAESAEPDGSPTMHNLFSATDEAAADLDVTSTMHDIFGDAPDFLSDSAETEEMPDLSNRLSDSNFASVDIDNTSTLQALSQSMLSGDADDELSKTLTQALGLLEKDYEDELTNSQILEQKDIQKAFAEHAAKDS